MCTVKNQSKEKKKDEPSSVFQRQRVDMLLNELALKFPPKPVSSGQASTAVNVSLAEKAGNTIWH